MPLENLRESKNAVLSAVRILECMILKCCHQQRYKIKKKIDCTNSFEVTKMSKCNIDHRQNVNSIHVEKRK